MDDTANHLAIIGMAGRFPGASDVGALWRVLCEGREVVGHFSDADLEHRNAAALPGVPHVNARGVLDEVDAFDAEFFGIPPREAEVMDPQHRLFLQSCWHALEDAGHDPARFPGLIGVYAGASLNTYLLYNLQPQGAGLAGSYQVGAYHTMLGNDKDFLPTRVSYKLGLRGPSMAVQTACSTSLVAVAQAAQALLSYQADLCLAGGVSISFPQRRDYPYTEDAMVSPDGHCRPFDADANGTVFGHGVGVVALRRLDDALKDGDRILAVIRGAAVNNDGAGKVGFAAPSVDGQAEVIALGQALAGVSPDSISYVEAHGTGTPLGDPIEVAALTQAFRRGTQARGFCTLGTAKGHLGHLDVAAGVTGLIKTVLQLQHRTIAPVLHFNAVNPRIALADSPFRIAAKIEPWTGPAPLRAGVSAFGVGGTNVHVVVEEAPATTPLPTTRPFHLLPLSARTAAALDAGCAALATHLTTNPPPLADVAYTLQIGRRAFAERCFVVAGAAGDAVTHFGDVARRVRGSVHRDASVAFQFPGQGTQHVGMAAGLYRSEPFFRGEIDRLAGLATPLIGRDLRAVLFATTDPARAQDDLRQTALAQPAIFVVSLALARQWQAWGITPQALIGHSVGEYVAAVLAGIMSEADALRLVAARGRLIQALPPGTMLSVRLDEAALARHLDSTCSIASINAPQLCVASGPEAAMSALATRLTGDGVVCRPLTTSHAFHSPMMEPMLADFASEVARVRLSPPTIPLVSTVTGTWLTAEQATDPQYWVQHVRNTVRYGDAVASLLNNTEHVLLEVGPGRTLTTLARQNGAAPTRALIASLPPPSEISDAASNDSDAASVVEALGRLWLAGVTPDWRAYHAHEPRRRVGLPGYVFARTRYWIAPPTGAVPPPAACAIVSPPVTVSESPVTMVSAAPPPTPTAGGGRRATLAATLRSLLAELSGTPPEHLTPEASFLELGFDSLLLTQVAMAIQSRLKGKVTFRQLLGEIGTLDALIDHLDRTLPAEIAAPSAIVTTPALPSMPALPAGASLLEQMIQQQMALMTQQLALLRGAGAPAATAPATPTSTPIAPAKETEFKAFGPYKPIQRGTGGALTPQQQTALDRFIARYNARTAKSKALTQQHRAHLADPRVAAGFRSQWKDLVYPIVTTRSKGTRLWDVDGNEYIDILNGFGCILFGHAPDFVVEAVNRQMAQGYEIGPQTMLAGEAAKLMCEMTGHDRTTFCNTGSEAVMAAMRLARTVTGRNRIVSFLGDYHGTFDEVLAKSVGAEHRSLPIAPGIPQGKVDNLTVLPYGTAESLAWIRAHAEELAAVLVEPVQSRHPALQPREFLQEVRAITAASGTALIMDEVITGFRAHPGGAQALFGVKGDLASYGKVIGGGMPIGVLCGSRRFMDALDGGMWQYGDDSFPEVGVTFFAGTFVRHPTTMAAVVACLEHLKAAGGTLQQTVNDRCTRLVARLNALFTARGVPTHIEHFCSWFYFTFPPEHRNGSLLYYLLRERGVHIQEGFPCFLTTAHTDADLDQVYEAFASAVDELVTNGFFPDPSGRVNEHERDRLEASAPATTALLTAQTTPAGDAVRRVALTEPQHEIWLAARYSREANCAYNESSSLRFTGTLDVPALQNALQALVARHEALRSRFSDDGSTQEFLPQLTLDLPYDDWSTLAQDERSRRLDATITAAGEEPFDLATGPLLRVRLFRLTADDHLLLLVVHHLVCDGWSTNVVCDELGRLYSATVRGEKADLAPAIGYERYATWQQQDASGTEYATRLKAWKQRLKDAPTPPELPGDHPRPAVRSFAGDTVRLQLDAALLRAVKQLGAKHKATLFTTLLTTFRTLIMRLTGTEDVVVGVPVAGQPLLDSDGDFLVGHCVNFLPLRDQVPGSRSVADLLPAAQRMVSEALAQQNTTYGAIVRELNLPREPNRLPLTEVQFNLERWVSGLQFHGLDVRFDTNPRRFVFFDLFINAVETPTGLTLVCDFNRDLFTAATITRWLGCFAELLRGATADATRPLARLPLMTSDETARLLGDWAAPLRDPSVPLPVHRLVERQAAATPAAAALRYHGQDLSYRQLDRRANHLATRLRARGLPVGARVAICANRSPELLIAVLGVLKAGCTYVPLDPTYPLPRRRYMLGDAQVAALIAHRTLAQELAGDVVLIAADGDDLRGETARPPETTDDLARGAYVIYTSGSTGQPKGVAMPHGPLANLIRWQLTRSTAGTERTLQYSPIGFDVSFQETFATWAAGGTLVLVDDEVRRDPDQLLQLLHDERIARLFLPFVALQQLSEAAGRSRAAGALREIITAGEQLQVTPALRAWLARLPGCTLHNQYGPSETHVVTCHDLTGDPGTWPMLPPIGRAITNARTYVLDRHLQPVPPGVTGGLYLGGPVLADGYLGREELTAERFVPDPHHAGGRMYHSGDLARWRDDGTLEFLGRADDQVKIRGYRIELGEIEHLLAEQPGIAQCAVAAHGEGATKRLVAYLVAQPGRQCDHGALRKHLRQQVPDYLVPTVFVDLPHLPTTPSGKIDRRALPGPESTNAETGHDGATPVPSISLHFQLLSLWEEVLDTRGLRLDDDFFAVGGNSLLAYRMMTALEQMVGSRLPMALLFKHPSILRLSEAILAERQPHDRPLLRVQEGAKDRRPFFFLHGDYLGGGYYCVSLARRLGTHVPFYALVPRQLALDEPVPSISDLAADYLREIRAVCPHGPYLLGGFCIGGIIAQEIARQLRAAGEEIALLALIDSQTTYPAERWSRRLTQGFGGLLGMGAQRRLAMFARLNQRFERLRELGPRELVKVVLTKTGLRKTPPVTEAYGLTSRMHTVMTTTQAAYQQMNAYLWASCGHRPQAVDAIITLVSSDEHAATSSDQTFGWTSTRAPVQLHRLSGSHLGAITSNLPRLADLLRPLLLDAPRLDQPNTPVVLNT